MEHRNLAQTDFSTKNGRNSGSIGRSFYELIDTNCNEVISAESGDLAVNHIYIDVQGSILDFKDTQDSLPLHVYKSIEAVISL